MLRRASIAGDGARTTGRPGSDDGLSWYARAAIIVDAMNVDMASGELCLSSWRAPCDLTRVTAASHAARLCVRALRRESRARLGRGRVHDERMAALRLPACLGVRLL